MIIVKTKLKSPTGNKKEIVHTFIKLKNIDECINEARKTIKTYCPDCVIFEIIGKLIEKECSPTICTYCNCMTKSIRSGRTEYKCGKCGRDKSLSDFYFFEQLEIKNED